MPEQPVDSAIVERVRKILQLAERAGTDGEREAAYARATEMMTKYMIDEAMLQAAGHTEKDELTQLVVGFGSTYWIAWRSGLGQLGRAFGFHTVIVNNAKNGNMTWTGWKSELKLAEVMLAHLQIQVERAVNSHMQTYSSPMGVQGAKAVREDRFKARRSFIEGWLYTVSERIRIQRAETLRSESRARTGGSSDLLPALVDRQVTLDEFFRSIYPKLKSLQFRHGINDNTYASGRQEGRNADIGQPRVGGPRGQLGR